jgi:putative ATP-binding cassette transporter
MPTKVSRNQSLMNDPSPPAFNKFWENVRAIVQPYWYPTKSGERAFSDVIRIWGMLILLILLIISLVGVTAFNSFVTRYITDVIEEKDYPNFIKTIVVFSAALVCVTLLSGFSKLVRKKIALDWYKWLNNHTLSKYLSNRAYYRINFRSDVDNPDQRISQELEPITSNALTFSATFLEKVLEMTTFLVILWSISQFIAIVLVVYTIVGNLIAIYLGQQLSKINQEELELKAEYNYCLTHVRNHAESIAFFQGEDQESNIIQRRFSNLLRNVERKINWENNQELFDGAYKSAIQIFPYLVLAPLYMSGQADFGEVVQASIAGNQFASAMATLIREFGNSGRFSSYVERLSEFSDALEEVTKQTENVSIIKTIEENHLAFENVTLQTPNYEQVIVEDLSLSVQPGEGLLIVGPSGRGKSSLLRAIAGLWNAGTGRLVRPPLEEVLFLPQRPYIILGTLREQLLYPNTNRQMTDAELKEVLQQVNLQNLLSRVESFDTEVPWENILSLGEQQRLAFARLLVTHPRFTILDEATSALDLKNEGSLYQQLQETKTTFISVGHRESLFDYHQWVLELSQDSSWQLVTVQDYRNKKTITQNSTENTRIPIDSLHNNEHGNQLEILTQKAISEGLSHKEMAELTYYSIKTIRSKASKEESITIKDGFTYRYDKDSKVLKWLRI